LGFLFLSFNLVGGQIPAAQMEFYYIGACLTDLLVIFILYRMVSSDLIVSLQRICIGFIMINAIAFILYMLEVSYMEFTLMYTVMYLGLLATVLSNGGGRVFRNDTMGGWSGWNTISSNPRNLALPTNKAKTRL